MIFLYIYIYFFSGSIKIFGGLICAQCFYNLLLKTDVSSFSSVIKGKAMMDAGMPRVLWLISSWQRPYFFPSETLILLWPCLGKKKKKKVFFIFIFLELCYSGYLLSITNQTLHKTEQIYLSLGDLAPHKMKRPERGSYSSWPLTHSDSLVIVVDFFPVQKTGVWGKVLSDRWRYWVRKKQASLG